MRRLASLILVMGLVAGLAALGWAGGGQGFGGWGGHMMAPGYHMGAGQGMGQGMGYGMGWQGGLQGDAAQGWDNGQGYCWNAPQDAYPGTPYGPGATGSEQLN